jgi:hypothetical protein
MLSCWYYEGNMKYVEDWPMSCSSCLSLTSFALVTQLPTSVLWLQVAFLDDKARVPLPTPQNDYLLWSSRH